jgi:hypothetical protein
MTTKMQGNGFPSFGVQMPDGLMDSFKTLATMSQSMTERWMSNRADQAQFHLDAMTKLMGCKNPTEAAALQQTWLKGTVELLTAEMQGYQEQVQALSKQSLSAFGQLQPTAPSRPHPKAA